jgi:hypothetical protein
VDEGHVVTFLYLHFANGKPHNIFTVLVQLALLPVMWIENKLQNWGLLGGVGCERESGVGMSQSSSLPLPGGELSRCRAKGLIIFFIYMVQSDSLDTFSLGQHFPVSFFPLTKKDKPKQKQMSIIIKTQESNLCTYLVLL